jgi:nitric oxide reductase NorD protein
MRLTTDALDSTVEQIFGQRVRTGVGTVTAIPASGTEVSDLERLSLLASALSGRTLQVSSVKPGQPAWTDGSTVFIDASSATRGQLEALAVQASLLAAGSLGPDIVRRLRHHPALARRYLAIEGHRALAANDEFLPPLVRSLSDGEVACRSDSPASSLAAAQSRQTIPAPPEVFGTIHARNVLASKDRTAGSAHGEHPSRPRRDKRPHELDADDEHGDREDTDNSQDFVDVFSSPVGGGGLAGRLLQKMLGVVRRLGEGGNPGADAPTHRKRSGAPAGRVTAVFSTADAGTFFDDDSDGLDGLKYPEWDVHRHRYRPNWCTVQEVDVRPKPDDTAMGLSEAYGLRRPLARLGVGLDRCHRQAQGDDIDIDPAVEARVAVMAGSAPDEAVYIDSLRLRRDLAVLILLDISGSVGEPGAAGHTVHEQQRAAAAALTVALHDLGDRVALYAFRSQGRSAVQMMPVKRFDDKLDTLLMRRLRALVPAAYSRLGAAIRHGASVLEGQGGTSRRLLVVISDGLAYDHGYERPYGAADTSLALAEARRRGTGCVCLTIGAGTDDEELQRVFGTAAHATISRLDQLNEMIGPLFRAALRSSEVRRRVSRQEKGQDA